MPKLFVANTTFQNVDFQYRLRESLKIYQQMIPIGGQIQISGDLSTPDIDYVVHQHAMYGMVRVDEIDRTKPFIGLCYDVDRRIDVEKMRRALAHNQEVLADRGKTIRQEAAMAVESAVEGQNVGLTGVEFTIEEEAKDGKDKEVSETIRVDRHAPPMTGSGKPPRAARGKR